MNNNNNNIFDNHAQDLLADLGKDLQKVLILDILQAVQRAVLQGDFTTLPRESDKPYQSRGDVLLMFNNDIKLADIDIFLSDYFKGKAQ